MFSRTSQKIMAPLVHNANWLPCSYVNSMDHLWGIVTYCFLRLQLLPWPCNFPFIMPVVCSLSSKVQFLCDFPATLVILGVSGFLCPFSFAPACLWPSWLFPDALVVLTVAGPCWQILPEGFWSLCYFCHGDSLACKWVYLAIWSSCVKSWCPPYGFFR